MKHILLFTFIVIITSCNQWSDKDTLEFMEQCEKTKWEKEFCNCAIEKVKIQYNSFSEIAKNENHISEILIECIDEDKTH